LPTLEECKIKQEELSQKVGKDRSTVSNYIRLLKLPTEVQVAIRDNLISMGHARALITIEDEKDQLLILQKILEKKLSVRQVEETVRNIAQGKTTPQYHQRIPLPEKIEKARANLKSRLNSKIQVKVGRGGSGKIIIEFKSDEEFDRIISKLDS